MSIMGVCIEIPPDKEYFHERRTEEALIVDLKVLRILQGCFEMHLVERSASRGPLGRAIGKRDDGINL